VGTGFRKRSCSNKDSGLRSDSIELDRSLGRHCKNEGSGAIPKDGSAHPTPHTRKRHRHDANVPETTDARFCSALPRRTCPEWAMKRERPISHKEEPRPLKRPGFDAGRLRVRGWGASPGAYDQFRCCRVVPALRIFFFVAVREGRAGPRLPLGACKLMAPNLAPSLLKSDGTLIRCPPGSTT
jgi:hypothetical protein